MYTDANVPSVWPKTLIWAFFDTRHGAADALRTLREAGQMHLVSVENTAVVEKDSEGIITFNEREDRSGLEGLGTGLLTGGLLSAAFPGVNLPPAAAGARMGLASRLRDAGFEDDELRTAAERMPADSSALFAIGTRAWVDYMNKNQWLDDVLEYLNQVAYRVGWIPVSETLAEVLTWRADSDRQFTSGAG